MTSESFFSIFSHKHTLAMSLTTSMRHAVMYFPMQTARDKQLTQSLLPLPFAFTIDHLLNAAREFTAQTVGIAIPVHLSDHLVQSYY